MKTRTGLLAAAILFPICASVAGDARTWHLLQRQADGGIASIIHGLTKGECDFAKARIEGKPATADEHEEARAREYAKMARVEAWMAQHHDCHGLTSVIGVRSSSEFEDRGNGECLWYQGHGFGRGYGPHDVNAAECFQ